MKFHPIRKDRWTFRYEAVHGAYDPEGNDAGRGRVCEYLRIILIEAWFNKLRLLRNCREFLRVPSLLHLDDKYL
jgi:hypothetical protein